MGVGFLGKSSGDKIVVPVRRELKVKSSSENNTSWLLCNKSSKNPKQLYSYKIMVEEA